MDWLATLHFEGIVIGICTFLIIGLFHPIVVKAEYYWGTRCWWWFLLLGIAGIIGSVLIGDILIFDITGRILFFFFLDHQRNIRAARTGAEGMVSHEP